MPLSRYTGVFEPDELIILQRVFDRLTRERGIIPKSDEGDALAAEIVRLRGLGLQGERKLLRALRRMPSEPD